MRLGSFLSFLFHLAILLLLILKLPDLFRQDEVIAASVPVQLATIADISGQPVPKPPAPKPVVKQDTPPPPPAPAPPTPPTPPEPVPQPVEQTPPPAPTPPPPQPPAPQQPAEQTPPEPIPLPEEQKTPPPPQEAKLEAPPPPVLRPPVPPDKPKPQKPAQQTQSFDSLLKNVEQMKTPSPDTPPQPQQDTQPQPDNSVSDLSAPQMSSSEKDAISSQVGNNWYLDAGKKGYEDFVIEIRATLAQDGTVLTAVIVDQARMATDANYRAAAEAARRAVLKSSPIKAPPEKYETWKTMVLRFSPQGVIGL